MSSTLPTRLAAVLVACTLLSACFEEPVREHLHLHLAAGAVVAIWTHEVDAPDRAQGNAAVARRMDASRDALARGLTPATGWFQRTAAAADRVTLERLDGVVRRGRWSAVLTDPRELENLLAEIGLTALVSPTDDVVELYLQPAASPRASRAQRELVDELITSWSTDIARYLAAAATLYGYLDRHPERATACFTHLFEEGDVVAGWPLDDDEAPLVEELADRVDDVAAALLTLDDQAFSLNELSRLVFDPFPARLTVSSAVGFVAHQGFATTPGGLERPPLSLWQALLGLEGLWISPDIVTAVVAPAPDDAQPDPDPAAFASRPRRHTAVPTPSEVEDEIRVRLGDVPITTVTWRGRPPSPDGPDNVQALLDAAEAAVPR